jgi:hypothetical protein
MQQQNPFDVLWAFVRGAALHMGAVGYWANRDEPQPYLLHEFISDNIEFSCGDLARHGFAGRAWADEAPLSASLLDAILAAAEYAGVEITPADVEAACFRQGRITPDQPLHEVSEWAGEVAAQLPAR